MQAEMNILVTGYHNPHYLTIVEYIENSVVKLGHKLISFEDHQYLFPGRLRKRFPLLEKIDLVRTNRRLRLLAEEQRPDLIIVTQGFLILKETLKALKAMGSIVVLWVIDAPIHFAPILEAAPHYDYVFCGGTEAIAILEKRGIKNLEWLPFACDPDHHFPIKATGHERDSLSKDVAFVGSYYPSRAKILEALQAVDCDFGIWGSGWDTVASSSPLKKHIRKTHTRPEEWIKIYSNSKIVLVTHYSESKEIPVYQVSPKVYEALACRALVFSDKQRDMAPLFRDGEHLVLFRDVKELQEKIRYFLAHDGERERIARKGYQEVIEKHTYAHRMKKLSDCLRLARLLPQAPEGIEHEGT